MTYGLAQCRVQPHRDLFEPVLLMRKTNKLSFALCLMSVDEQLQHPWNEQCPANAPTKKKSDNLSAHKWSEELKLALEERYQEMWDFVGKVQSDGWLSRQIGEDPELHATRLREYLLREVSNPDRIEKFWPPQPLKTHGQQFLGQV